MQKTFDMNKCLIQKIHQEQVNDFNTSMISSEQKKSFKNKSTLT